MQRYIEAVIYGDTWGGYRGVMTKTIPVGAGERIREVMEETVIACDDFQPRSKRFGPETVIVLESRQFEMRHGASVETRVQRRLFMGEIPCLSNLVEPEAIAEAA